MCIVICKYIIMEEYKNQYNEMMNMAIGAINNNNNIVISGPEYTGKSHLRNNLKQLLLEKNYDIYYGIQEYVYRNRTNNRIYSENNFWIEELENKEHLVENLTNNYERIITNLRYPN